MTETKTKALLSAAAILAADDLPTREVDVPEWGGTVRIRAMTAAEREELEHELLGSQRDGRIAPQFWREKHVAAFCIDGEGKRIFTDADAKKLAAKSGAALDRVFMAINSLNAAQPDAIEAAAKN
jgi:hypothetical protein